jgi:hypothetical protein
MAIFNSYVKLPEGILALLFVSFLLGIFLAPHLGQIVTKRSYQELHQACQQSEEKISSCQETLEADIFSWHPMTYSELEHLLRWVC